MYDSSGADCGYGCVATHDGTYVAAARATARSSTSSGAFALAGARLPALSRTASVFRSPTGVLVAALLFSLISCERNTPDPIDVYFFHDEICPSCETYQTAIDIGDELLSIARKQKHISVEIHNMIAPGTFAVLEEQLELRGLPNVSNSIPIILIDSTYFTGYDNVLNAVEALKQ